jgi:hypothetical protein
LGHISTVGEKTGAKYLFNRPLDELGFGNRIWTREECDVIWQLRDLAGGIALLGVSHTTKVGLQWPLAAASHAVQGK